MSRDAVAAGAVAAVVGGAPSTVVLLPGEGDHVAYGATVASVLARRRR